ncbi:MAG: formimidoylglutamate deiminase [Gammaproteobacteria bacterium]|jgi:formimidoylglutamate deiminase|nr:formimidoylglutamate deiminase [Gammaproteobacteria bacterium]
MTSRIWAAAALLPDGWAKSVGIDIDANGDIISVSADTPYLDGERVEWLIAAIPNVHSHAHQRAMAGLGERAGDSADSFWTWRKVMYHYLERIQPEHLNHIAAQLYLEMLKAGYGCVGEFQYLHHGIDGKPYGNRAEMSLQCLQAARQVGIGFTALPVLYRYGGFGSADPLDGQRRFLNNADEFVDIVKTLQSATAGDGNCAVGIAPHSLRAINRELLSEVIAALDDLAAIHLHIAEQTKEVDDCLAWCNQRPVEWLYDNFAVDQNWCLIHATHMSAAETSRMAASGCIAGLCPTTEANLGDGFFNAAEFFAQQGCWAIGSDSHISIDPVEELRWLEYGMRLQTRRRNVLVSPTTANTGRNLLDGALAGGARACGRRLGRIETGSRADFVVLDHSHPRLYGRATDDLLDSWIFSGNDNLVRDVYVGGNKVIDNGHHANEDEIARNYRNTLDYLAN